MDIHVVYIIIITYMSRNSVRPPVQSGPAIGG